MVVLTLPACLPLPPGSYGGGGKGVGGLLRLGGVVGGWADLVGWPGCLPLSFQIIIELENSFCRNIFI